MGGGGRGAHLLHGAVSYADTPAETPQELSELEELRGRCSWAEWKAHPLFKKDRVMRMSRKIHAPGGGPVRKAEEDER